MLGGAGRSGGKILGAALHGFPRRRHRRGGVALDVYEEAEGSFFENLSGHVLQDGELARLPTFPNVLGTAHQAFLTGEALSDMPRTTVANLEAQTTGNSFVERFALT
jgi:D-lactate dehydrogenase